MNALAYRRAVALAHACGLDWAAWAMGLTTGSPTCEHPPQLRIALLAGPGSFECALCGADVIPVFPVPTRIEDFHAPYLEDCKRRGVEPGPMPALEWTSGDCMVHWEADARDLPDDDGEVRIVVGCTYANVTHRWARFGGGEAPNTVSADLIRLAQIVAAVAEVYP